jgi:hypothetical protein
MAVQTYIQENFLPILIENMCIFTREQLSSYNFPPAFVVKLDFLRW